MNGMAAGLRMAARGVALAAAVCAGQTAAAPVLGPPGAAVAPGLVPAVALQSRAAAIDSHWAARPWRFRPVASWPAPVPPLPPPGPWGPVPHPGLAGPAVVPRPLPPHPAGLTRPPAETFAGVPAFVRQYAWRPPSPREQLRPAWGASVPVPPPMAAWADGRGYRFRPMPAPIVPRYAADPRWVHPPLPWQAQGPQPYAGRLAPPAPWLAQGPAWPAPAPTMLPAWHPASASFAAHAYRFRPDHRLGPAGMRWPTAAPWAPELAWGGGEGETGHFAAPWGQQPEAGPAPWDRAYN